MACPYPCHILTFIVVCGVDNIAVFAGDDIFGEVANIIDDNWFAAGEDLFYRDGAAFVGG